MYVCVHRYELAALFREADKNNDGTLTFDELYELVVGSPLPSTLQRVGAAFSVLKTPQTATGWWEGWSSLAMAPWIGRLNRASALSREVADWFGSEEATRKGKAHGHTHSALPTPCHLPSVGC